MLAICCMTMQPEHFSFWLHHHLNVVGVNYILLRVENTFLKIPDEFSKKVILCEQEHVQNANIDSIIRQQERQKDFVNRCLYEYCPGLGILYLLHIDDDELLLVGKHIDSIQGLLEKSFRRREIQYLRIQNYEAVLRFTPQRQEYFFQTSWFKNANVEECRSYKNGKSIAFVSRGSNCNGCHTFTGNWLKIAEEDAIIAHYDSITFDKWKAKFNHLKSMTKIPKSIFPFYQQSIELFLTGASEESLYKFWKDAVSQCTNPINISVNYRFFIN